MIWQNALHNCFKTFKIMKLTLCTQRRKIIIVPLNILSNVSGIYKERDVQILVSYGNVCRTVYQQLVFFINTHCVNGVLSFDKL